MTLLVVSQLAPRASARSGTIPRMSSPLRSLGDEYRYGSVLVLVSVLIWLALALTDGAATRLVIVVLQALTLLAASRAGQRAAA